MKEYQKTVLWEIINIKKDRTSGNIWLDTDHLLHNPIGISRFKINALILEFYLNLFNLLNTIQITFPHCHKLKVFPSSVLGTAMSLIYVLI